MAENSTRGNRIGQDQERNAQKDTGNESNRLSSAARSHMLFPVLDYVGRTQHSQGQKLGKMETDISEIKSAVQELNQLLKAHVNNSFSLKDSGYMDSLRAETASLFCDSLFRQIEEGDITKIVRSVLRSDASNHAKSDKAVKYVKQMFSTFRAEERRKIFGLPPCQKYAAMPTEVLRDAILKYMKPHMNTARKAKYLKHLTIVRKYIRAHPESRSEKLFYVSFKEWLIASYPPNGFPTNADFDRLISDDRDYQYGTGDTSIDMDQTDHDSPAQDEHMDLDDEPLYPFD